MAKHVLSLEAPDTLNLCILRLVDTSIYNEMAAVTCARLQVTVPGFNTPVEIKNPLPGFVYNLTACNLELQSEGCGTTFSNLPDGIYILKYSVSPNDQVYVEYNHLRISKALDKIQKIYCELDIPNCLPPEKIKKRMDEVRDIREYLYAAKAKVERCHEPRAGMEIFKYAMKLLDKINCKTC
jgi:hypothetical protein